MHFILLNKYMKYIESNSTGRSTVSSHHLRRATRLERRERGVEWGEGCGWMRGGGRCIFNAMHHTYRRDNRRTLISW